MPADLWEHLPQLESQIRAADELLVLSDFDGTLVPISPHPDLCRLDPEAGRLLQNLARMPQVHVGIVSGRSLANLIPLIQLPELLYAGNHGLEITGPNFVFREPTAVTLIERLQLWIKRIRQALQAIPGAWVEDKELTASIHYRQVPVPQQAEVEVLVRQLLADALERQEFLLRSGKAVLELRPNVPWDKGKAVQWLTNRVQQDRLAQDPGRDFRPWVIYLGDDETDEDVFTTLTHGLSIHVGHRYNTTATYALSDSSAVFRYLEWLNTVRQH